MNDKLVINGLNELSGHVTISGSKNSTLALLAASLCTTGVTQFQNVPALLSDIQAMFSILRSLGARVDCKGDEGTTFVGTDQVFPGEPVPGSVSTIRGSIFVLGPLVARFGMAVVALPGGCDIGARPVHLYVRGLRALGASVQIRDGKVHAKCGTGMRLKGGKFRLDYPSVGATETLLMAASLADGLTTLSNVAQEPEVDDLVEYLIKCGAEIEGKGTTILVIKGKEKLTGCRQHVVIPDRIEAGTFAIAATISRSCLTISPVIPQHIATLLRILELVGCTVTLSSHDTVKISGRHMETGADRLHGGIHIVTGPYPEFPTDLQPQIVALLSTCRGSSVVEETVFENRMEYVKELHKLGANIQISGNSAIILGDSELCGSTVVAKDLRGGAALVLAALAASGTTEIDGLLHINRGYEDLLGKLQSLGAKCNKIFVEL